MLQVGSEHNEESKVFFDGFHEIEIRCEMTHYLYSHVNKTVKNPSIPSSSISQKIMICKF